MGVQLSPLTMEFIAVVSTFLPTMDKGHCIACDLVREQQENGRSWSICAKITARGRCISNGKPSKYYSHVKWPIGQFILPVSVFFSFTTCALGIKQSSKWKFISSPPQLLLHKNSTSISWFDRLTLIEGRFPDALSPSGTNFGPTRPAAFKSRLQNIWRL